MIKQEKIRNAQIGLLLTFFKFFSPEYVLIPFGTCWRQYIVDNIVYRYLDAYVFGVRVARINLYGWIDK